ncbi:hypothetical protein BC826DRAFT_1048671, partial [Russula brevipes]
MTPPTPAHARLSTGSSSSLRSISASGRTLMVRMIVSAERHVVHTGYWSLVAALDRALEEGIPITDPSFYATVFREFGGSFQGFVEAFQRRYNYDGTALQLAQMVTDTFPSFRDEHWFEGRRIFFWKRAQIMIAETWAAFSPPSDSDPHPLIPRGIGQLTMFADYRVPQVLHHLRLLTYAPPLVCALEAREEFPSGAREEIAIRAASIIAVERVAAALRADGARARLEVGEDRIEGIKTQPMLPAHRTRSI